ncbi:MAG: hypothetical protein IJT45_05760, partial [Bacteroidales bacterium]|nr:hypothetical protein [Bacteroidales bacterium]
MKKVIMSLAVAMMVTTTVCAQQIAVVKGSVTNTYQTLQEAIDVAESGSVVYLPGGGFPVADTVRISKLLTIVGISHKVNSDNADGSTIINGNVHFMNGSDGSAIMGCYITKDLIIGEEEGHVDHINVKYCNTNAIDVKNSSCDGIFINQNYIRAVARFSKSNPTITNNIVNYLDQISSGTIKNNVITGGDQNGFALTYITASIITDNIIFSSSGYWDVRDCQVSGNICGFNYGDDCIRIVYESEWRNMFVNPAGVSTTSDYHFTDDYQQYSNKGIYGGSGFSDGALPPIPYISEKKIAEQTDAAGKLSIRIKVNAGGSDGSSQGGATGGSDSDVSI